MLVSLAARRLHSAATIASVSCACVHVRARVLGRRWSVLRMVSTCIRRLDQALIGAADGGAAPGGAPRDALALLLRGGLQSEPVAKRVREQDHGYAVPRGLHVPVDLGCLPRQDRPPQPWRGKRVHGTIW